MTQEEARLIRTCICNGFEFYQKKQNDVIVIIGNEKFSFNRLCSIADEVEQAVEKQTPKKPIRRKDGYFVGYSCPNCKGKDYFDKNNVCEGDKHCSDCGQALDWSDNNA